MNIDLVAGDYKTKNWAVNNTATINLIPKHTNIAQFPFVKKYLQTFPGMRRVLTLDNIKNIRENGIYVSNNNRIFIVADNYLYEMLDNYKIIERGEFDNINNNAIIRWAENPVGSTYGRGILISTGQYGYMYNLISNKLTKIIDTSFLAASNICFIDGYFINYDELNNIYFSNLYNGYNWGDLLYSVDYSGNIEIKKQILNITLQTGLEDITGRTVYIYYNDVNWMYGYIITYDSNNGNTIINITDSYGQGNYNDFSVLIYDNYNTKFINASAIKGRIKNIAVVNNHLWVFGDYTIEIFYNRGQTYGDFVRVTGAVLEYGLFATNSLVCGNNRLVWLAQTKNGKIVFCTHEGFNILEIEAPFLLDYKSDDLIDCKGYNFNYLGGEYYVFVFNKIKKTYVWEAKTNEWFMIADWSIITGEYEHINITALAVKQDNVYLCVNKKNYVLKLDDKYYKYDNNYIVRQRDTDIIYLENAYLFFNNIEIEIQYGDVLSGDEYGSYPYLIISWSDDFGKNWTSERFKLTTRVGEYIKRIKLERLGRSRRRMFRIKYIAPTNFILLNAFCNVFTGDKL